MEFRHLRYFLVLAEELHYGRAAQRLHMTQPPLTQAIAGLERTLGLQLFDRTKRSVQLTPAGAALLPQVLDLLDRAQALPAQARAAAAGEVGRLRLAGGRGATTRRLSCPVSGLHRLRGPPGSPPGPCHCPDGHASGHSRHRRAWRRPGPARRGGYPGRGR